MSWLFSSNKIAGKQGPLLYPGIVSIFYPENEQLINHNDRHGRGEALFQKIFIILRVA